jgi:hypothetical protein
MVRLRNFRCDAAAAVADLFEEPPSLKRVRSPVRITSVRSVVGEFVQRADQGNGAYLTASFLSVAECKADLTR